MNEAFDDALVEGWEPLESAIELPDLNDRHVVAAALRGRADAIITENVKDFPTEVVAQLGIEIISVDSFLLDQLDLRPHATCRIIAEQSAASAQPPVSTEKLLTQLARSGAPGFASAVATHLDALH